MDPNNADNADKENNNSKMNEIEEKDEVSEVINEKIKNSVQSFLDSLTGQSELRPDKLGDCFKKAIDCSEFDEKVQSGMKKVIELYYNSSRKKYEEQFKVDMKIILKLDLSLNSNEDLMALLPNPVVVNVNTNKKDAVQVNTKRDVGSEPVVVKGTVVGSEPVVVQGTIVGSNTVVGSDTKPDAEPEPDAEYVPLIRQTNKLTKEQVENMKKGDVITEESFNELSEDEKKLFEKDYRNYDPFRLSAPTSYLKKE
jgi:hypothetical protein